MTRLVGNAALEAEKVDMREFTGRPVLNLLGCYRHGHEATGPNQSFRALSAGLNDEFAFHVLSSSGRADGPAILNRQEPFCMVREHAQGRLGAARLRQALTSIPHDLLLLNGFFDQQFTIPTILMRRAGLVPRTPAILSPRGEFGEGALSLKSRRKRAWIKAVRHGRLLRDVWLHATEEHEREDLERADLRARGILFAPDTALEFPLPAFRPREPAEPLRLAFLGRVAPVKNLLYAIKTLGLAEIPCRMNVFGPIEDAGYWARCEAAIATLPPYIEVHHRGIARHAELPRHLAAHDLLFLPTLGENFGHAIHEALLSGTPVLISDKTPWRGLQTQKAGWDLPLDQPARFVEALRQFGAMSAEEARTWREGARGMVDRRRSDVDAIGQTRRMFQQAIMADRLGDG